MVGKIALLVSVAAATMAHPQSSLQGVDPNTLSCESIGHRSLLLPSFDDCSKFVKCVRGREVEFTCPLRLWFDFPRQRCGWPGVTKCVLRSRGEDEIDGEEGSGDDSEWGDKPPGHHSVGIALNCADASSVKLAPHRDDCQRYWRCNNGIIVTAFCSDGLYFNHKTLQCDFEANVVCLRDAHEEIGGEFIRY